ncbi:MAG TPA: hypothetical protein VGE07_14305 [Herpetosiphonaceae bacterium]
MSAPFRFTANHDVAVIGDPELWQEARRRVGDLPELEAWLERADGQALVILASGDRA